MIKKLIPALFAVTGVITICGACGRQDGTALDASPRNGQPIIYAQTTAVTPPPKVTPTSTPIPTPTFVPTQMPTTTPAQTPLPMSTITPEPILYIEPTPVPTAVPTLAPVSASTPEQDSGIAGYDEYFSNSVFVGDSVMEGFAQYVRAERKNGVSVLSDAQFLTTTIGIRVADIVGDTENEQVFYSYKGSEMSLDTILTEMGITRAFIMLGMNDMAHGYTVEETITRYQRMLEILAETNPGIEIIVMTTTPKTATQWLPSYVANKNFGSPLLNELSESILAMCRDKSVKVIDINAVVRDADGNLPNDYSRDGYVHINNECSAVVLEALREFADEQEN